MVTDCVLLFRQEITTPWGTPSSCGRSWRRPTTGRSVSTGTWRCSQGRTMTDSDLVRLTSDRLCLTSGTHCFTPGRLCVTSGRHCLTSGTHCFSPGRLCVTSGRHCFTSVCTMFQSQAGCHYFVTCPWWTPHIYIWKHHVQTCYPQVVLLDTKLCSS